MGGGGGGDVTVEVVMVVNIFALFLILMGVLPEFSCDVCCSFLVNVFSSSFGNSFLFLDCQDF